MKFEVISFMTIPNPMLLSVDRIRQEIDVATQQKARVSNLLNDGYKIHKIFQQVIEGEGFMSIVLIQGDYTDDFGARCYGYEYGYQKD